MCRGNFLVAWMSATIFFLLVPFAITCGAADSGGRRPTDMASATVGVTLVIPPRIEIGSGGHISMSAGPGKSPEDRGLCVSSNSNAFTVMAIGKNPGNTFSLGQGPLTRGYRVTFGGHALAPGQRISLPPQVPGLAGCARGSGMKLEVSLPRGPGKKGLDKGQLTDVLTLVFAAT